MQYKLEICVDSLESAINAQIAGADRIELCSSLPEGGTTPSYGTIIAARNNLTIEISVIIRPRGSDFLYKDPEYGIMRRDIEMCGEAGADCVVFGILSKDGNVDIERTSRLVEAARPMKVTFHRAFDLCIDPVLGLEDIILSGADRILTSGQKTTAFEGAESIKNLVKQADGRIIIMPGSGINELNIEAIAKNTGAMEFHLSTRNVIKSDMMFIRDGLSLGGMTDIGEYARKVSDPEKIANIIKILNLI
jgi:copper homeostasis protein